MQNYTLKYLEEFNLPLKRYDGLCNYLAIKVRNYFQKGYVIKIEAEKEDGWLKTHDGVDWYFHAVFVFRNRVHDPWYPKVLPVDKYLTTIFPNQKIKTKKVK